MPLSRVSTIAVPAVQTMTKGDEVVMAWLENLRPVLKRTVIGKTTKDKGGSLSSAVYTQPKQTEHSHVSLTGSKELLTTHQRLVLSLKPARIKRVLLASMSHVRPISLTFVNNLDVPEVQVQDIQQQGEYETDRNSITERDNEVGFQVISKTCMTSLGRAVRAFVHFAGGRVGLVVKALAFH